MNDTSKGGDLVPVSGGDLVPAGHDNDDNLLYEPPSADSDPSWQRALQGRSDSERELVLARYLADAALRGGSSPNTIAQLTSLAAKLVEVVREEREEDAKRVGIEEVAEYARTLAAVVREVLESHDVPGWQDLLAEISYKITSTDITPQT